MKGPPILNPKPAGPTWSPREFVGVADGGRHVRCDGMARRVFVVFAMEANGLTPPEDQADWPVLVAHLPTGFRIASAKHGAQGFRIGDALLEIEEFGLPLNVAALESRAEDIATLITKNGGLF